MRYWLIQFQMWMSFMPSLKNHTPAFLKFTVISLLLILGSVSLARAQTEDTTRTPRELPEEQGREQPENLNETPYQIDILQPDIERYELRDYGSSHRFYRQLNYRAPEDFLMSEEEGYKRYGAEWERKINEDLLAILRATFKEDSEIMKLWKSIAPFLSFGIWEPYEVPITRVDYENKVPVSDNE